LVVGCQVFEEFEECEEAHKEECERDEG